MKKTQIASASALALILTAAGSSTIGSHDRIFTSDYENVLGTSLEIKTAASSQAQANKAEAAVLAEISRESKILSTWDPASEVSRWEKTHNQAVPVSDDLFQVLSMYDQ